MSAPSGPVAYTIISGLNVYNDGQATITAYGVVVNPDGSFTDLAGGWSFAVDIAVSYGMTSQSFADAIGSAVATGYGVSAPDVVLLP